MRTSGGTEVLSFPVMTTTLLHTPVYTALEPVNEGYFEQAIRRGGVAIDASELFPRVTTWLGFPRDSVLRGYMVDFVNLFAPHYSARLIRDAARARSGPRPG